MSRVSFNIEYHKALANKINKNKKKWTLYFNFTYSLQHYEID